MWNKNQNLKEKDAMISKFSITGRTNLKKLWISTPLLSIGLTSKKILWKGNINVGIVIMRFLELHQKRGALISHVKDVVWVQHILNVEIKIARGLVCVWIVGFGWEWARMAKSVMIIPQIQKRIKKNISWWQKIGAPLNSQSNAQSVDCSFPNTTRMNNASWCYVCCVWRDLSGG